MKAKFLTGKAVGRAISRLVATHDELHWAVAWGTNMKLADQLVEHSAKFRNVTFGLAFGQTDPDFLDALVGIENCYAVRQFAGGTYQEAPQGLSHGQR